MKKILVVLVVIILSLNAALSQGRITLGDKTLKENKKEIKMIKRQINDFEKSLEDLHGKDTARASGYFRKIDELERVLCTLLSDYSGKRDRSNMEFKSKDPRVVAEAYYLVKQADNLSSGSPDGFNGILVNKWNLEVIAVVTGSGFYREFSLKPNSCVEFKLPVSGKYKTVFIRNKEEKEVTKSVGANIIYYEGGKAYDYKATLLSKY